MKETEHYSIYKSEIFGQTMALTAATLSFNPEKKRKWHVMARLESKVLQAYLAYVDAKGQTVSFPLSSKLGGYAAGILFGLLPWTTAMKLLGDGTGTYIDEFQRLLGLAERQEKKFFGFVLAHELAITDFARQELAGNGQDSCKAMEALIGEV